MRWVRHSSCNKPCKFLGPKNALGIGLRYRRVDAWVTGLEWLKTECIAKTPMSEQRCHVLPLPLDERWFTTKSIDKNRSTTIVGTEAS